LPPPLDYAANHHRRSRSNRASSPTTAIASLSLTPVKLSLLDATSLSVTQFLPLRAYCFVLFILFVSIICFVYLFIQLLVLSVFICNVVYCHGF
jgi:hypothetical protein